MDDSLDLRTLYAEAGERAVAKQLAALDVHCVRFLELSPFAVLSTAGADGRLDASPRGGPPGFVKAIDARTLWLPDAPGNNRLDSLQNIQATGRVGLLFFVPGVDETLRVNGGAKLSTAIEARERCATDKRLPKLVIEVTVEEAYLHCAKALMRSRLWDPEALNPRSVLPSMGRMLHDQIGIDAPPESQQAMVERYRADL